MKTLQVTQILSGIQPHDIVEGVTLPVYTYRVEKVTNSTTPQIRHDLTHDELDHYCDDDEWEVTIK